MVGTAPSIIPGRAQAVGKSDSRRHHLVHPHAILRGDNLLYRLVRGQLKLAKTQPVEQHADRGQLLDAGRRGRTLQPLHVSGDIKRPDCG